MKLFARWSMFMEPVGSGRGGLRGAACAVRNALAEDVVFDNTPNGRYTIFPGDLLAVLIGTARVGDAHFIDAAIQFGDFCCHFWLNSKATFFQIDFVQRLQLPFAQPLSDHVLLETLVLTPLPYRVNREHLD